MHPPNLGKWSWGRLREGVPEKKDVASPWGREGVGNAMGGPSKGGQRRLEDRGCVLFTFAFSAERCCDISLFNLLKSSANFVIHPSAWCTEKRMCHTSAAIESRTETAHMGERDNPKMEPFQLQEDSALRVKWASVYLLQDSHSLGGNRVT